MASIRLQPTFRVATTLTPVEAVERLRQAVANQGQSGEISFAGSCFDFRVAPDERRLWSPHLSVQVDADGAGSELFGRFSPRPEVWTFFMMLYFLAAFAAICGAVYGGVQWLLGWAPWAGAATVVGLAAIAVLHLASLVGQRLSVDQMAELRQRFDDAVQRATDLGPQPPATPGER